MSAASVGVGEDPSDRGGQRVGVPSRDDQIPAPLASSSTAWGKAVATTGRPAAIASTSTPEVTWSRESYGSTTTRPSWISSVSAATSR